MTKIIIIIMFSLIALPNKNSEPLATENVELMHKCSPEHLRMGK